MTNSYNNDTWTNQWKAAEEHLRKLNIPDSFLQSVPVKVKSLEGRVVADGMVAGQYHGTINSPKNVKLIKESSPGILKPLISQTTLAPARLIEQGKEALGLVPKKNAIELDPVHIASEKGPGIIVHEFAHAFQNNLDTKDYETLTNLMKNFPAPVGGPTRHHPEHEGDSLPAYFDYALGNDYPDSYLESIKNTTAEEAPPFTYDIPEPILEFIRRKQLGQDSGTTAGDGWTVQSKSVIPPTPMSAKDRLDQILSR